MDAVCAVLGENFHHGHVWKQRFSTSHVAELELSDSLCVAVFVVQQESRTGGEEERVVRVLYQYL